MKTIGVLFGMENTFPGALVERINGFEIPEVKARKIASRALLVGAVYEVETGRVRILDTVTLEPAAAAD